MTSAQANGAYLLLPHHVTGLRAVARKAWEEYQRGQEPEIPRRLLNGIRFGDFAGEILAVGDLIAFQERVSSRVFYQLARAEEVNHP